MKDRCSKNEAISDVYSKKSGKELTILLINTNPSNFCETETRPFLITGSVDIS